MPAAVLLLLASLLVSAHAFVNFTNYKSLIEELQLLPEESCMSIAQLQEVVAVATYHTTVGPNKSPRKAVVLTSCGQGRRGEPCVHVMRMPSVCMLVEHHAPHL